MKKIPVGISGRHIHLSKKDLYKLFGDGYQLSILKELSQPGQFAAKETVEITSPKNKTIQKVRILGPARNITQVEISRSDAIRNGFDAPLRHSGDTKNSGSCEIKGPKGKIKITSGVIVADRHIHFSLDEAKTFGVSDGDYVSIKITGEKPAILEKILCRVRDNFKLDCHLDTDDGSAFNLKTGDKVIFIDKDEIKAY